MSEKWPLTPVATARLVMDSAERKHEDAKAAFYQEIPR